MDLGVIRRRIADGHYEESRYVLPACFNVLFQRLTLKKKTPE